jgi:periplasmic protein TonB
MSYTSEKKRGSPAGMGAAVLVNGSIILAVALSPLVVQPRPPRTPIIGDSIALTPPKPKPDDQKDARDMPPVFVPKPVQQYPADPERPLTTSTEEQNIGTIMDGVGGGDDDATEFVYDIIKPPVSVFKAAQRDPNFSRSFQPDYPVGMLQREIEGTVTVRVLVGANGRVKQVSILSATDPAFARATEKQALRAWRFTPATRDGEAVEDWQTLTVRFDIN